MDITNSTKYMFTALSITYSIFGITAIVFISYHYNRPISASHNLIHFFENLDAEETSIINFKFFIYDDPVFQWWNNCTKDTYLEYSYGHKHGDDVLFYPSIKDHPMRTYSPEKAEIFVIPIMPSWLNRQYCESFTKSCDKTRIPCLQNLTKHQIFDKVADKEEFAF